MNRDLDAAVIACDTGSGDCCSLANGVRAFIKNPSLPVVYLSDLGARRDERIAQDENAIATISKPVRDSALLEALSHWRREAQKAKEPAWREPTLAEATGAAIRSILLVDDNVVNQKVGVKCLEKLGFKPDVADCGMDAIGAVERRRYDVVFMDVQMPGIDGLETTKKSAHSTWSMASLILLP